MICLEDEWFGEREPTDDIFCLRITESQHTETVKSCTLHVLRRPDPMLEH